MSDNRLIVIADNAQKVSDPVIIPAFSHYHVFVPVITPSLNSFETSLCTICECPIYTEAPAHLLFLLGNVLDSPPLSLLGLVSSFFIILCFF